ncbi:hypothetical protein MVI27_11100 [Chryseobacterium salipaludis]|uniref:hypothetical protein n=1 Tax=Chryseobacterium TaxID=59732 RepID=UPI001FF25D5E|nr:MULTISPECIES: hypothetical protein [Chryseobacterium]MCJ8498795.1 hypothetical protein [Chryseobacterium salipaludis]MCX3297363.1 hypothetical protein [Planobacterium sp. JC490]
MNKLWLLLPIFLMNCSKNTSSERTDIGSDTVQTVPGDTVDQQDVTHKALPSQDTAASHRTEDSTSISRTFSADRLPLTIDETFSYHGQELLLKIQDFKRGKITGTIEPADKEMNIRFNQLRYPDETWDGPFGRDINLPVTGKGELWLRIGRSNMASGKDTGSFHVHLK